MKTGSVLSSQAFPLQWQGYFWSIYVMKPLGLPDHKEMVLSTLLSGLVWDLSLTFCHLLDFAPLTRHKL